MISLGIIGTGSSGNGYIVDTPGGAFAVDNGFSALAFMRTALELGFDHQRIRQIFVTHTHSDHFKGVERLSKQVKSEVFIPRGAETRGLIKKNLYKRCSIDWDNPLHFDHYRVDCFETSHDCVGSSGYSFLINDFRITFITDTGIISERMFHFARESSVLVLEANYCETMLANGPYPEFLKERIQSDAGHLSNSYVLQFLRDLKSVIAGGAFPLILFSHISEKNNAPDRIREQIIQNLDFECNHRICEQGEQYRYDFNPAGNDGSVLLPSDVPHSP